LWNILDNQRQGAKLMMDNVDYIDKLGRGVMACHKKGIKLKAIQEAVETFWGVAESLRPTNDKEGS
jgi:hypothetical protein